MIATLAALRFQNCEQRHLLALLDAPGKSFGLARYQFPAKHAIKFLFLTEIASFVCKFTDKNHPL